jgi:hypothetical protein
MNPNGTFGQDLERWLADEAPTRGPIGLHDAIIERARTMRQRPGWIVSLRGLAFPGRVGSMGRPGVRVAYLLVVLGITCALVVGAIAAGGLRSQPARPVPSTAMPTHGPAATSIPVPQAIALDPGTYYLPNPGNDPSLCLRGCAGYERITFTLPAGWAVGGRLVSKHLDQPGEVAFSVWTVDQVYADPCHWQGSALSPLDLANHAHGPTGIILAPETGGLANQALRGSLPRALTHVTLGGVIAVRIDLSVPAGLDTSTCDQGQFRSWTEWDVVGGANSHNAPGQLDAVYMVDVDRRTLVIDASHMPAASKQDLAELDAVLRSMIIDRGFVSDASAAPDARPIPDPSPAQ